MRTSRNNQTGRAEIQAALEMGFIPCSLCREFQKKGRI